MRERRRGSMKFRVRAKETWLWEQEFEAENKETLEDKINEEFTELFDTENSYDYEQDWTIEEVKDD